MLQQPELHHVGTAFSRFLNRKKKVLGMALSPEAMDVDPQLITVRGISSMVHKDSSQFFLRQVLPSGNG